MTHNVVIKYTAPEPFNAKAVAQICSVYYPHNAAADLQVFDGTYYDTNVRGFGEGMALEQFMAQSVAFPKLNAYLRKAIRDGQYEFSTNDENMYLFLEESAAALADQGFEFIFA